MGWAGFGQKEPVVVNCIQIGDSLSRDLGVHPLSVYFFLVSSSRLCIMCIGFLVLVCLFICCVFAFFRVFIHKANPFKSLAFAHRKLVKWPIFRYCNLEVEEMGGKALLCSEHVRSDA